MCLMNYELKPITLALITKYKRKHDLNPYYFNTIHYNPKLII